MCIVYIHIYIYIYRERERSIYSFTYSSGVSNAARLRLHAHLHRVQRVPHDLRTANSLYAPIKPPLGDKHSKVTSAKGHFRACPTTDRRPNLPIPTKVMPTKICWLNLSRKFRMDVRIPPRKLKIMLESNPLKSRILVRRLAVDSAVDMKVLHRKILRVKTPGGLPLFWGILRNKIMTDRNPQTCRILLPKTIICAYLLLRWSGLLPRPGEPGETPGHLRKTFKHIISW